MAIPIWVYLVLAGIISSAYMAIITGKEERKLEMESIEREGEIYMQRLAEEKEQRKGNEQSLGV